jgi:hypothetical protein
VVHQAGTDRRVLRDGQRAKRTTAITSQAASVVQDREGREALDEGAVPAHERGGMHEDDPLTVSRDLVGQLDVVELEFIRHDRLPARSAKSP